MNLQDPFDIISDLQIPPWINKNLNNIDDPSIFITNPQYPDHFDDEIHSLPIQQNQNTKSSTNENSSQQKPSISEPEDSQESEQKPNLQKQSGITKKQPNNKKQRRNEISRNYRQRKKEYSKQLQTENKFLRYKVDELTFRLQQVTSELNKIKHNTETQSVSNFHAAKTQCLNELENMIATKVQDVNAYAQIEKKLFDIVAFDGKQKVDLLNYFMSELMENLIEDRCFYFIDCLLNKKGFHRANQSVPLNQLDIEVFETLNVSNSKKKQESLKKIDWEELETACKKFRTSWKGFYQDYLSILNQGFKIQRIVERIRIDFQNFVTKVDLLKLEIYFEKNKYRPDIREMRNIWFREIQRERYPKEWKQMNHE